MGNEPLPLNSFRPGINERFFIFQSDLHLLFLLSVISVGNVSSQQHDGVDQVPTGGLGGHVRRQVLLPPPPFPRNNPSEKAEKEAKKTLPFLVLGTQQVEVFRQF